MLRVSHIEAISTATNSRASLLFVALWREASNGRIDGHTQPTLARKLGLSVRQLRYHVGLLRRKGYASGLVRHHKYVLTLHPDGSGSTPGGTGSTGTAKKGRKSRVGKPDQVLSRRDARKHRRSKHIGPKLRNKLVGNLNGDVGLDQRGPDLGQRRGRVPLGQLPAAGDQASGYLKSSGQAVEHAASLADLDQLVARYGLPAVDAVLQAGPKFRGGRGPCRRMVAKLVDAYVRGMGTKLPTALDYCQLWMRELAHRMPGVQRSQDVAAAIYANATAIGGAL